MPFRLNEYTAKIQFATSAEMPSMIYKACVKTGCPSNTVYIRTAVAEALSRDLGIPVEIILARIPEPKGKAAQLFGTDRRIVHLTPGSSANTVEGVK